MSDELQEGRDDANKPYLITVVGGRGSLGTTSCITSLASSLASTGLSCLVSDAPESRLVPLQKTKDEQQRLMRSFMTGAASISSVWDETDSGFFLLPSLLPLLTADLLTTTRSHIAQQLTHLDRFDVIIMEGGDGIRSPESLTLCGISDLLIMVVDSEVDSMRRAYAFVKSVISQLPDTNIPELALIINASTSPEQAVEVGEQFVSGVARFLDRPSRHLGTIPFDPSLIEADSSRSYFVSHPYSEYAKAVNEIAKGIQQYQLRFISTEQRDFGIRRLGRVIERPSI